MASLLKINTGKEISKSKHTHKKVGICHSIASYQTKTKTKLASNTWYTSCWYQSSKEMESFLNKLHQKQTVTSHNSAKKLQAKRPKIKFKKVPFMVRTIHTSSLWETSSTNTILRSTRRKTPTPLLEKWVVVVHKGYVLYTRIILMYWGEIEREKYSRTFLSGSLAAKWYHCHVGLIKLCCIVWSKQ